MNSGLRALTLGWVATALFVALPATAEEARSARQWLEQMVQAAHQLNFEGVLVYSHAGHMQTLRIVHGRGAEGERERLLSLSGPQREVLRDNDKVTCILPDDNEIVIERTGPGRVIPLNLPKRIESLEQYYEIRLTETDRIAGYPAQKITITPRDHYRYGHVFWLHSNNGLLLRSELLSENKDIIESMMFTALQFHDTLPANLLEPETSGRDMVWQRQGQEDNTASAVPQWIVASPPPGFMLDNRRNHLMPGNRTHVEHLVFTDGLASVSVFVEQEQAAAAGFIGNSHMGAVNAHARLVDGHHVTVVGEVPAAAVRRIADSVAQAGKQP